MRTRILSVMLAAALLSAAAHAKIVGDYIETRSADVYTGQCFANGESGLVGDQAILAWHVRQGTWNGVKLDGLNVVAAVKASATLGDPYGNPYPAKAVIVVDDQASPAERAALVSFAKSQGGKLLADVVKVEAAPIDMQVIAGHSARAMLRAGTFVNVETRGMSDKDHVCGNEETYYQPLTPTNHAMPAVAVTDKYQGPGLGVNWTLHDKRSAFVGSFGQ
jgi:hypothetical protein